MLILAFDTATEVASVALVEGSAVLGERRTLAKRLLEDVDALLQETGAAVGEIGAIAVGVGPGSFTSTRIGLAVARGLALALDVPVAGGTSLDALVAGARDAGEPEAVPVVDARRREVFVRGPAAVDPAALELVPGT
ncbi:MAG: tRNA (adenosine(37)-N6)-threonylcarbamoyltransferase complex dimerization subunit type 1 TsaB, partial [Actinobacteria bacterium]|nr:tRNA (adenosine(37)-N6)-threonylcarbamoyltransferase complex dimerization subunit type 1 TsaB [Actinomycetota bacterium]